jgi:hypothetical protein
LEVAETRFHFELVLIPDLKSFIDLIEMAHLFCRICQVIADLNGEEIHLKEDSIIFMPLYQSSGEDGYFLIRKTPEFFLKLSTLMRLLKVDRILPLLPGIIWIGDKKQSMLVDLKIARFLTKPFLHLMGYRAKQIDEEALIIKNREASSRNSDYKNEDWY